MFTSISFLIGYCDIAFKNISNLNSTFLKDPEDSIQYFIERFGRPLRVENERTTDNCIYQHQQNKQPMLERAMKVHM